MGSERFAKKLRRLVKHTYHFRNQGDDAAVAHTIGLIERLGPTEADIRRAVKVLVNSRRIHVEASMHVPPSQVDGPTVGGDQTPALPPPSEGLPLVRQD